MHAFLVLLLVASACRKDVQSRKPSDFVSSEAIASEWKAEPWPQSLRHLKKRSAVSSEALGRQSMQCLEMLQVLWASNQHRPRVKAQLSRIWEKWALEQADRPREFPRNEEGLVNLDSPPEVYFKTINRCAEDLANLSLGTPRGETTIELRIHPSLLSRRDLKVSVLTGERKRYGWRSISKRSAKTRLALRGAKTSFLLQIEADGRELSLVKQVDSADQGHLFIVRPRALTAYERGWNQSISRLTAAFEKCSWYPVGMRMPMRSLIIDESSAIEVFAVGDFQVHRHKRVLEELIALALTREDCRDLQLVST
jgi:hypothetical protein